MILHVTVFGTHPTNQRRPRKVGPGFAPHPQSKIIEKLLYSSSFSPLVDTTSQDHPKPPSSNQPKWRTTAARLWTFTSPASAAPPTASSRPRITALSRSPSPRLTRTAVPSRARTTSTPSAVSSEPWARATTPSTDWPSVTVSSRASGADSDKGFQSVGKKLLDNWS